MKMLLLATTPAARTVATARARMVWSFQALFFAGLDMILGGGWSHRIERGGEREAEIVVGVFLL